MEREYGSPYTSPAYHMDLGTLTALRRLGVPWGTSHMVAMSVQLGCVSLPVLQWLVEQGAPPGNERELLAAVLRGRGRGMGAEAEAWLRGLAAAAAGAEAEAAAAAAGGA